jgi:hypothetical protein
MIAKRIFYAIFAVSLFFLVLSCQKVEISKPFNVDASKSPNGFVITGDGFTNRLCNFNIDSLNVGYYDTTKHWTVLNAAGDTNHVQSQLHINFSGNTPYTAQKQISSPDSITISIVDSSKVSHLYASVPLKTLINVTRYDLVKGKIMGTFKGSFVNTAKTADTVSISNGRFSVLRKTDKY